MTVLSPRESATFACFTDTVCAPAAPLPPVAQTDAVAAFDAWLALAPRLNRVGARGALLALGAARFTRRTPAARLGLLDRVEGRVPAALEALRAAAAVSYYGDARVSALLGYAPRTR